MLPVSQQQQSASKQPTNKRRKRKGNSTKKFNNNNRPRPNWRNQKSITKPINWSPTPSDDSDQEVCLFYMAGRCNKTNGDCPYSHDVKIPKVLAVCKHYVANSCSNTETCRFLHQEFPCKFFHSSGLCQYGSECKFSHERNELTTFLLEKYHEDEASRTSNIQEKVPVFEIPKCSNNTPQSSHNNSNIETTVLDTPEYVSQLEIDPEQIQNQMDIEQEQQHPVSLPLFSHFYQDTTQEPQHDDNNDAPMPLEISSILSAMENEPPSSPLANDENQNEEFLFSKQLEIGVSTGQGKDSSIYPAKVITITLPSINEHSVTNNNDVTSSKESMTQCKSLNPSTKNINWRVCKVQPTKRIDYHHIKQSSSMREILMDPRLNKHRA